MPYIALQLVGHAGGDRRRSASSGTGYRRRPAADHRLRHPGRLHLFERPARAGLDRHRQGHPDLHHRVRRRSSSCRSSSAASARSSPPCRRQKLLLAAPGANTTGAYGVYATLALGSALALFLYPHSLTGILSASSGHAIRRNAAMLPAYSLMLGLLALVGFFAIAAGVANLPEYADGFKQFGNNFAVPALFLHSFPVLVRRHRLRRDRHRRAGAGGDHVDRRGQSLHPQHPPRVHQPESDRQAGSADGEVGVAGGQVRRADLHHLRAVRNTPSTCSSWAASGSSRRCRR